MNASRILLGLRAVALVFAVCLTIGQPHLAAVADDSTVAGTTEAVDTPPVDQPAGERAPSTTGPDQPLDTPGDVAADTDEQPTGLAEIRQEQPSFYVNVEVDRPDRNYVEGDSLGITVTSPEEGYAYVLYQQADGKTYQIFPNSVQQDNRVAANRTVAVPSDDDRFRWQISAPFGKEHIQVIVVKEPLAELDDPALRDKRFNPVSADRLARVAKDLEKSEPIRWGESQIGITTHPAGKRPAARPAKRFGVFFGVSNYEYNGAAKEVGRQLDLPFCHNDARLAAALMSKLGQLDDVRVFVDEEATLAQMRNAITGWLPDVSRPGDAVFIYFSGHGGQGPDDNGDEIDGKDEWLIPHDFVGVNVLFGFLKQRDDGRLNPQLAAQVERWRQIALSAGPPEDTEQWLERANAALARATGVTDDLFGRWLQALAGRQVVVIADACRSGGMAAATKGFHDNEPLSPKFDFLTGEVGRLKDIGQPEAALLAACQADQDALAQVVTDQMIAEMRAAAKGSVEEWEPGVKVSLMTYFYLESLLNGPRPMDLDHQFAYCRDAMAEHFRSTAFQSLNEWRVENELEPVEPHEPLLDDGALSRPIIIKP
jgi:hypothetical protein